MPTKKYRAHRDIISVELQPEDRQRLDDIIILAKRVDANATQQTAIKNLIRDMHDRLARANMLPLRFDLVAEQSDSAGGNGRDAKSASGSGAVDVSGREPSAVSSRDAGPGRAGQAG